MRALRKGKLGISLCLIALLASCGGGGGGGGKGNNNGGGNNGGGTAVTPAIIPQTPDLVTAGDKVNLNTSVIGGDNLTNVQWTQVSGAPTPITNPNSAHAGFNAPDVTTTEKLVFKITGDSNGQKVEKELTIVVNPTGMHCNAGDDFFANGGNKTSLHISASSSNGAGGIASYVWKKVSGADVTLDTTTPEAPSFDAPDAGGVIEFEVAATDNENKTCKDWVTVTVEAAPAPIISSSNSSVAFSGDTVALAVHIDTGSSQTLPQGATLLWQQIAGPTGITLSNPGTLTPSFVAPTVTEPTNIVFRATLITKNGSSSVTFPSAVIYPTGALVVDAGADRSALAGDTIDLNVTVNQTSAGTLSYAWSQKSGRPATLSDTEKVKQQPSIVLPSIPAVADSLSNTLVFEVTVSDGTLSRKDQISISLNRLAVTAAITDGAAITRGNTFYIDETAHLQANTRNIKASPVYAWSKTSGPAATLTGETTSSASVVFTTVGSYTFSINLTDSLNNTAVTDSVSFKVERRPVVVVSPPTPQTADPLSISVSGSTTGSAPNTVFEGDTGLSATVQYQNNTDPTTVQWTSTGSPAMTFTTVTTQKTVTFTAPTVTTDLRIPVIATVTDANSNKSATINYTVKDLPVSLSAMPKITSPLNLTNPVIINLAASAKGGKGVLTYTWTQESGANTSIAHSHQALASVTPTSPGLYVYKVTVTDTLGNTAAATQTVEMLAAPVLAPAANPIQIILPSSGLFLEGQVDATIQAAVQGANPTAKVTWEIVGTNTANIDIGSIANNPVVESKRFIAKLKGSSDEIPAVTADTPFTVKITVNNTPDKACGDSGSICNSATQTYTIINRNVTASISKASTAPIVVGRAIPLRVDVQAAAAGTLTYLWTTSDTNGTFSSTTVAAPTYTPSAQNGTTPATITATVSDHLNNTATATFTATALNDFVVKAPYVEVDWPSSSADSEQHLQVRTEDTSTHVIGGNYTYSYSLKLSTWSTLVLKNTTIDIATLPSEWKPIITVDPTRPHNPSITLPPVFFTSVDTAAPASTYCARGADNHCQRAKVIVDISVTSDTGIVSNFSSEVYWRKGYSSNSGAASAAALKYESISDARVKELRAAFIKDVADGHAIQQLLCASNITDVTRICEQLHIESDCPVDKPYGILILNNNKDASRTVDLKCGALGDEINDGIDAETAYGWYNAYSDEDKCTDFDFHQVYTDDYKCIYAFDIPLGAKFYLKGGTPQGTYTP